MKLVQFEPLFIRHFSTTMWPFSLHSHNHYELMYIGSGKGMHEVNGVRSPYVGETFFFLSPEDSHDFRIEDETEFNVIKFLPAILKGGTNSSATDYWDHLIRNLVRKQQAIADIQPDTHHMNSAKTMIGLMISAWLENDKKVTEVHTHLLRALLLTLDKGMSDADDHYRGDYAISKIERIQNYIHTHIRHPEKLTMKQLSAAFSTSESGLKSLFKDSMGMSLGQYISSLKLEMIKERMISSKATLTEIAHEFGFVDSSHFNSFFKKMVGMAPLGYRKQNN